VADRPPVIAAWGAGVDSTAMIVELADRGEPIDMLLFDDPGSCDVRGCDRSRPTYAISIMRWERQLTPKMAVRGFIARGGHFGRRLKCGSSTPTMWSSMSGPVLRGIC